MYAQQIEGDSWRGEKMDKTKIDKMSGESSTLYFESWILMCFLQISRLASCMNS